MPQDHQDAAPDVPLAVWTALTRARNSVRDFRPDPIPDDALDEVLADALTAPSWSNTQPYRIALASGEVRDRISAALCANYDAGMRARRGGLREWAGVALTRRGLPDGDFRVPEQYPDTLICGVAIGYPSEHPVNRFRPGRVDLDQIVAPPRPR